MKLRKAAAAALCIGLLAASLSGCSETGGEAITLNIAAASSLTDAFTIIGDEFTAAHPGVTLNFNFAGSSALAEQVNAGAPVDVFASASASTMRTAVDAGSVGAPTEFAANSLAIVVPKGNPAGIKSLSDLADPDVKVAVCAASVPCGAAAKTVLENAGVSLTPVTLESEVRAVLTKVAADEVDAGLVYVTDALAASSDVESVDIPVEVNAATTYLIANVLDSNQQELVSAFIEFVLSERGQEILAAAGFKGVG